MSYKILKTEKTPENNGNQPFISDTEESHFFFVGDIVTISLSRLLSIDDDTWRKTITGRITYIDTFLNVIDIDCSKLYVSEKHELKIENIVLIEKK